MPEKPQTSAAFGPNAWLVDEMYEQYRQDPKSVSESWQEFFADYTSPGGARGQDAAPTRATAPTTNGSAEPVSPKTAAPAAAPKAAALEAKPTAPAAEDKPKPEIAAEPVVPLKGAAARIVQNMEASL